MKVDLYTDGYRILYEEGDESLERRPINHREDINDTLYMVKDGDKLTNIAFRFYNNPLLWFLIADANGIINPFELESGKNIIIPNQEIYEI